MVHKGQVPIILLFLEILSIPACKQRCQSRCWNKTNYGSRDADNDYHK